MSLRDTEVDTIFFLARILLNRIHRRQSIKVSRPASQGLLINVKFLLVKLFALGHGAVHVSFHVLGGDILPFIK